MEGARAVISGHGGPSGWRPLLEGELAARAAQAIGAIDGALAGWPVGVDGTLLTGSSGRALFHAYLAHARGEASTAERAEALIAHATDHLLAGEVRFGLYDGFTGLAWTLAHLPGRALPASSDDPNEDIDVALAELLSVTDWPGSHELMYGLAGLGVYALERLPRPAGRRALARVVVLLDRLAVRDADGVTWRAVGGGEVNLGVAHGLPALVGVLAAAHAAGVEAERALRLCEGAVAWLLARRLPEELGFTFALAHAPGRPAEPARPAWCYGEPGIAAVLLAAAQRLGKPDWSAAALAIARRVAARPLDRSGVTDACVCHGAVGVAHLLNRVHQASGDPSLADAARRWYAHALDLRQDQGGVGGYRAWDAPSRSWRDEPGFIDGAAGIGLALLAATTAVEPAWDRLLLASLA